MVKEIFLKYLVEFELILRELNYLEKISTVSDDKIFKDNIAVEYFNHQINRKIIINYGVSDDEEILLGLTMYKIPREGTFFSLYFFLDNHNLNDRITVKLPPGGDIEPFVKKYFEDLKSLFENELSDQITGKSFENHMDALRKSWDEY